MARFVDTKTKKPSTAFVINEKTKIRKNKNIKMRLFRWVLGMTIVNTVVTFGMLLAYLWPHISKLMGL